MFLLLGVIVTLAMVVLFRPWSPLVRIGVLAGLALAAWVVLTFARGVGWIDDFTHRGAIGWWETSPAKELLLLLAMLVGIFARVVWDAVDAHKQLRAAGRRSKGPQFDKWDFVMPALISLLAFQTVLSVGKEQALSVSLAIFSFQNGFFWNTIFARVKQSLLHEVQP